MGTLIDINLK